MPNRASLTIDGLDDLRAALKALPADLVRDGAAIVHAHADAAAQRVRSAYPVKTGHLQRGVRIDLYGERGGAAAVIRSRAPHAHLYEDGTGERYWNTKRTGAMPARHVLVPIAIAQRRVMVAALIDLVTRAGITVTATAA